MLILTLLACGGSPDPTPEPATLGLAIASRVHALAWVAEERGLYGRPVEVTTLAGSAATLRMLVAGNLDLALAGGDAVLKANAAGADLVVLAGFVNRHHHRLVAAPGITSAEGLRGGKAGLPFLGGPQDSALKAGLTRLGLGYGTDVQVLNLGRELNRIASLENRTIDVTLSSLPTATLEARGLHVLVDLPALDEPFPYLMLIADRTWLADHPDVARDVLGGLCDAVSVYRDDPSARALVDAHLHPASDAEAVLAHTTTGPSTMSFPPVPDVRGFVGLPGVPEPPRGVFSLELLESLRDSGRCGGR